MKNKICFGLLIGLIFALPLCFAAEALPETLPVEPITEDISEPVEEITLPEPGISPDNPLYGLDIVMEKIQLALTFNKAEKAKKGLVFANERLAEVKAMVESKNMNAAQIAQEAHDDGMATIETEISEIEETNATEEMGEIVQLREQINTHQMVVQKIGESILKTKGNLTEEQQAMIAEMVQTMEQSTLRLKVEVQNKEESSKVKIKLQTGQTEEEVDTYVTELTEKYQLEEKGKSGVYSNNKAYSSEDTDVGEEISNKTEENIGSAPENDKGQQDKEDK